MGTRACEAFSEQTGSSIPLMVLTINPGTTSKCTQGYQLQLLWHSAVFSPLVSIKSAIVGMISPPLCDNASSTDAFRSSRSIFSVEAALTLKILKI
ncbi:MAG: hypothetical protein JRI62_10610 [Deltaproteobacteria bacterium]|nr:hypothetical protein [Deltaproteobacteria bacterium]